MSTARPFVFFSSSLDSPEAWRRALDQELGEFDFVVGPECADPAKVDVALVYSVPRGGLRRFENLKAVVSLSAGVNQFRRQDLPPFARLCRSVDRSLTQHMVVYARAAVLRYLRRFDHFERSSREALWRFEAPQRPQDMSVGVLGLGELGSAIALALGQDGFQVHGWSRSTRTLNGVIGHTGEAGLRALAGAVEIVLNVLPLNTQTRGILNRDLFSAMRDGSYLINMGRGAHLVEYDLLDALGTGKIAGATLDVASVEPLPSEHALWRQPSVLITPHVAGLTETRTAATAVAQNIRRAMSGAPLHNEVEVSSLEP
ncbi:glyoxylate/hydroxypyruvate reductase A [Variovorax sp. J31P207]|uniref:2-hydroxyacid dehydrogenase n=1 Tax=Variovorax sp. J31P207 TaxID=3053510 RepID=UPI0025770F50|nr:glyoxylate/hydroxypyruvate reductase A [Variovorax sp. J31P207]MDM0071594.1 glyoxylate/hydroxypyruvate reductase A [Variovorax sp. J31P207]